MQSYLDMDSPQRGNNAATPANVTSDFYDLWHEVYSELCVLKCQVYGLAKESFPDAFELGLQTQLDRLFDLHNRLFESVVSTRKR